MLFLSLQRECICSQCRPFVRRLTVLSQLQFYLLDSVLCYMNCVLECFDFWVVLVFSHVSISTLVDFLSVCREKSDPNYKFNDDGFEACTGCTKTDDVIKLLFYVEIFRYWLFHYYNFILKPHLSLKSKLYILHQFSCLFL